ncbi:hypothetical protein V0M98_33690 (plasmid) [Pseudomonas silesiensis]|uniref:hypothetical protein n=1 Tax=Pseudomonas silesiensis TaxID=1853130 RepID=UPI0030CDDDD9
MSFAKEKSEIHLSSHWFTVGLVLLAILVSWACIRLDHARGAAYMTVPVVFLLGWCSAVNISYRKTRKIMMCIWALCLVYWTTGNALLMQVISVEAGEPIVTNGPIYDVSVFLAAKKPQA